MNQITLNNKTTVYLGEMAWYNLFSKYIKRYYVKEGYDSYDDSVVDTYTMSFIFDELNKNDWHNLVGIQNIEYIYIVYIY